MPDLHPEVELPISLLRMSQHARVSDRPDKRRNKAKTTLKKTRYICNKIRQKRKTNVYNHSKEENKLNKNKGLKEIDKLICNKQSITNVKENINGKINRHKIPFQLKTSNIAQMLVITVFYSKLILTLVFLFVCLDIYICDYEILMVKLNDKKIFIIVFFVVVIIKAKSDILVIMLGCARIVS